MSIIGINIAGAEFGQLGSNHGGWPKVFAPDGRELGGYIYPSASVLAAYAADGVPLARVPFMWERMQAEPNGPLVASEVALLKKVLVDAQAVGIKIIPDCHNSCRFKGQIATPAMIASLWGQLAPAIKDMPALEAYDMMNEPHDMGGTGVWYAMAEAGVVAIRQHDPTRKIHVAGDGWSGAWHWMADSTNLLPLFKRYPGLVAHAHQYLDSDGSGTYGNRTFGTTSPDIGVQRIKPFVEWCNANGIEGFIGEFGVPGHIDPAWYVAQNRMLDYMVANKIGGTAWAGGAWWPNTYPLYLGAVGEETHPNFKAVRAYFPGGIPAVPTQAEIDALKAKVAELERLLSASQTRVASVEGELTRSKEALTVEIQARGAAEQQLAEAKALIAELQAKPAAQPSGSLPADFDARLAKARLEVNTAKNGLGRAVYALDQLKPAA